MLEQLRHTIRLIAAAIVAAVLSVLLQGCSAAQKQMATCIAGKTACRCAPQCLSCVRDVVHECQAAQAATPATSSTQSAVTCAP